MVSVAPREAKILVYTWMKAGVCVSAEEVAFDRKRQKMAPLSLTVLLWLVTLAVNPIMSKLGWLSSIGPKIVGLDSGLEKNVGLAADILIPRPATNDPPNKAPKPISKVLCLNTTPDPYLKGKNKI